MVDVIYHFVSFRYERKYADVGAFILVLNDLEYIDSLKRDNYLMVNGECYVIENIHRFKNGRNEIELEITGQHLSSILDRRVLPTLNISTAATYEAQMYSLVNSQFVNPSDADRKISFMTVAASKGLVDRPAENRTLKTIDVLTVLKDLCIASGLGFRMNFYPEEKNIEFEVYQGRDLTEDVFFSEEYGNVASSDLYEQGRDYKNVGYLSNGTTATQTGSGVGLERREFIIVGSDMADVRAEMSQRGVLFSAECDVILTDQFDYRKDWDLGDTVTFIDNSLEFVLESPIIEIKETHTDKLDIDVTFGDRIPTIFEKLSATPGG